MSRDWSRVLRVALVLVVGSCAARQTPTVPAPAVWSEVTRAEAAERQRRHDVARHHYERAVAAARDPASLAFARREFADTLLTWGEDVEAMQQLEGVVAATPTDASAWHDLGVLRQLRGDTVHAVVALERAKSLAPRDLRPRRTLAAIHWKHGDRSRALAEYRALAELPLPHRMRPKVEWAIRALVAQLEGIPAPPPP